MNNSLLYLSSRKKINIEKKINYFSYHDNSLVFVGEDNIVYFFDMISDSVIIPSIVYEGGSNNIRSVSLSPNHDLVLIGADNGSLLLINRASRKVEKSLIDNRSSGIISSVYINQNIILFVDKNYHLISYTPPTLFRFGGTKEKPIITDRRVLKVFIAPVVENRRVVCPTFENFVFVHTEASIIIMNPLNNFEIKYEIRAANSVFDVLALADRLLIGACYEGNIVIYSIVFGQKEEVLFRNKIDSQPSHLSFISSSIISVISHQTCTIVIFSNNADDCNVVTTTVPETGLFLSTPNFLSVINSKNYISMFTLPTLKSLLEKEDTKLSEVVDRCLQALNGNPIACIGLSAHPVQRSLMINFYFSTYLKQYTIDSLSESGANPEKIFEEVIGVAKLIEMKEFITHELFEAFQALNQQDVYFRLLIADDPHASKFVYTESFFESIITYSNIEGVFDFVLNFPESIASSAILLQKAKDLNNLGFLVRVLLQKMDDIIGAISVYESISDFESIKSLLLKNIDNQNQKYGFKLIKWLFSIEKTNQKIGFPRFEKMVKIYPDDSVVIFDNTKSFIEFYNKPFGIEELVKIGYISMNNVSAPHQNPVYSMIDSIVLEKKVLIDQIIFKPFFLHIFNNQTSASSNREALLLHVIKTSLPQNHKKSIVPLCKQFGFLEAYNHLLIDIKDYSSVIEGMFSDPRLDFYNTIERIISEDAQSKESIRQCVYKNNTLMLSKNPEHFTNLLSTHFPDIKFSIIPMIKDVSLQGAYIRSLILSSPSNASLIPEESMKGYIEFLCKYFPNEVLPVLLTRKADNIMMIKSIFEKNNILDGLSYVCFEIGDYEAFSSNMIKFYRIQQMLFVKKEINENSFQSSTSFILNMIKESSFKLPKKRKDEHLITLAKEVIALFNVSFYYIQTQISSGDISQYVRVLQDSLVKIITLSIDFVSYDSIIDLFSNEFGEIQNVFIKESLLLLINNFTYQVDTLSTKGRILRQDESNAFNRYVKGMGDGLSYRSTLCDKCMKGLINEMCEIAVFPCGHVFHKNLVCVSTSDCPICNPDEKIYQDEIKKSDSISNVSLSTINRFERKLNTKFLSNNMDVIENKGSITLDFATLRTNL